MAAIIFISPYSNYFWFYSFQYFSISIYFSAQPPWTLLPIDLLLISSLFRRNPFSLPRGLRAGQRARSRYIVPRTDIRRPKALSTLTHRGRCAENLIIIDPINILPQTSNNLSRSSFSTHKFAFLIPGQFKKI